MRKFKWRWACVTWTYRQQYKALTKWWPRSGKSDGDKPSTDGRLILGRKGKDLDANSTGPIEVTYEAERGTLDNYLSCYDMIYAMIIMIKIIRKIPITRYELNTYVKVFSPFPVRGLITEYCESFEEIDRFRLIRKKSQT